MNFETLKKSHLKRNIIIGVMVVAIISAIVLNFTRAKYKVTQSIPLVNGTINYSLADLNVIAMYQANESGSYDSIDEVPVNGYILNEEESYCEVNGEKDSSIVMAYENGAVNIGVKKKGTKCYLYFDKQILAKDSIIINYPTVLTRTSFTSTITNTTTGTIYKSANSNQYDDDGEVYYFAGNPKDNWVKFAGFYWRIIRINGDGSIRLIYQGTTANATGTGTQITTSAFSPTYSNNMYVGYMYTSGQVHGTESNSTIKGVLDNWYTRNLTSYASSIDGNAGFCGDRTPSTSESSSNNSGGTGSTTTYYGGYIRLITNKSPSFKCSNSSDLYTTSGSSDGNRALTNPIGLITADEVSFAGMVYEMENRNYYLYTGEYYWTMSPSGHSGGSCVFLVSSSGDLGAWSVVDWTLPGVRPVINLKSDVTISSGNGTASNPYTIS